VPGRTVVTDPAGAFVNFEVNVAARGAVGHGAPFVDSFPSLDASSGGSDAKLASRGARGIVGTNPSRGENAVKPKPERSSQDALHHTLMTLLLVLGSAAPVAIAFFLVASTNDENPLDKIPDYETLPSETLAVPFDRSEPTYTEFEYWDKVRLVIEGVLSLYRRYWPTAGDSPNRGERLGNRRRASDQRPGADRRSASV
jgi:hypothetical protein